MKKKWKSIAAELVALLVSAIFVVPIWMIFVNSLKDSKHANQLSLSLAGVNLKQAAQNYAEVFRVSGLTTAYLNSTIITVLSVALIVLTASMAAFIIQRRKQKWVGRVNSLIILGMTMPGFTVPTYFLLKSLGLLHTYLGASSRSLCLSSRAISAAFRMSWMSRRCWTAAHRCRCTGRSSSRLSSPSW